MFLVKVPAEQSRDSVGAKRRLPKKVGCFEKLIKGGGCLINR